MTKKLFALVLAAMLAVTMFAFPASAVQGVTINNIADDNTISYSWGVASGATTYSIVIKSGTTVLTNQTVSVTAETNAEAKCKGTYRAPNGGKITIEISARDASGGLVESYYSTVDVPIRQTGTNGVSVMGSGTSTTVTWSAVQNVTNYYVEWVYSNGSKKGQFVGNVTSCQISESLSNIKSVTVYKADSNNSYSTAIGSCNTNGGSTGGNYPSTGITVSNVYNGSATISWGRESTDSYYVIRYTDANGNWQTLGNTQSNYTTIRINNYAVTGVQVYAYGINGSNQRLVGYATIPTNGSGNNSTYGQLTVNQSYNGTVVSWPTSANAVVYHIKYTSPINNTAYDEYVNNNYYTFNFGSNTTWNVAVYARYNNGSETFIGAATITPNGVNNNYNTGISNGNQTGYNCSVTRYANEAYLVWNVTNNNYYGNSYRIVYSIDGTQGRELYSQTPAVTIPVGSSYAFTVAVYDVYTQSIIASGSFAANKANNSNALDIKKSEIKNIKVTNINSYTTKLSWDKVSDAGYYMIQYGSIDGSMAADDVCYNNYYEKLPFGSSKAYYATVYYWSNTRQRYFEVGHVYNVPGTSSDSDNTAKNYPSEFKATSGTSKKITLSWTAADGASYYNVYYKRATSSKWLKINKDITKTAVNVSGLTDGVSYQFKVVPNKGVESGVLSIAPSTTSSTVRAKDPASSSNSGEDGDVSLDDDTPSLRSVTSGSKGSVTVAWNNVGASSYRIYVAEANTNTYKYCGTYTGTQATITSFGSGSKATSFKSGKTYKVRVVRSDYKNYGSINSALSACSPLNVTVK